MSKAIVTSAMREVGLVAELLCETGERERKESQSRSASLPLFEVGERGGIKIINENQQSSSKAPETLP